MKLWLIFNIQNIARIDTAQALTKAKTSYISLFQGVKFFFKNTKQRKYHEA